VLKKEKNGQLISKTDYTLPPLSYHWWDGSYCLLSLCQFFEKELLALEGTLKSPLFTWGLRIFIIALVIILIKGKKKIRTFFAHRSIKWALYIIVFVGALGWLAWFLSLL
jgi:drug/metabolite transporter (DMT)-like permease